MNGSRGTRPALDAGVTSAGSPRGQAGDGQVTLVHLAIAGQVAGILRAGVRASAEGPDGGAGVWCHPLLDGRSLPERRRLELRRGGHRSVMAVHVALPATVPVLAVGPGGAATPMPVVEADALIRAQPDPAAWQVFVPRSIPRQAIRFVRHVPFLAGVQRRPDQRDPAQRPHPRPAGRRRLDPAQRPPAKAHLLAPLVRASDPGDAGEPPRPAAPADEGG